MVNKEIIMSANHNLNSLPDQKKEAAQFYKNLFTLSPNMDSPYFNATIFIVPSVLPCLYFHHGKEYRVPLQLL